MTYMYMEKNIAVLAGYISLYIVTNIRDVLFGFGRR